MPIPLTTTTDSRNSRSSKSTHARSMCKIFPIDYTPRQSYRAPYMLYPCDAVRQKHIISASPSSNASPAHTVCSRVEVVVRPVARPQSEASSLDMAQGNAVEGQWEKGVHETWDRTSTTWTEQEREENMEMSESEGTSRRRRWGWKLQMRIAALQRKNERGLWDVLGDEEKESTKQTATDVTRSGDSGRRRHSRSLQRRSWGARVKCAWLRLQSDCAYCMEGVYPHP